MSKPDFANRRVLVTGGTKGIGRAAALLFAELGAVVTVTYAHDERAAAETRRALAAASDQPHAVARCDNGDTEMIRRLVEDMDARNELPTVLVCNAAFQRKALPTETSDELMEVTYRTNVVGTSVLIRSVCDRLVQAGRSGSVVVSSSDQSEFVNPTGFAYSLSKAALNQMVRHLALFYAPHSVRINAILFGWFDTEGERTFYSEEFIKEQAATGIPMARAGDPTEAAHAIVFLASERASYATGSLVRIDGGYSLSPDNSM